MLLDAQWDIVDALDLLDRVVTAAPTSNNRPCQVDRIDECDGMPAEANLVVSHGKTPN